MSRSLRRAFVAVGIVGATVAMSGAAQAQGNGFPSNPNNISQTWVGPFGNQFNLFIAADTGFASRGFTVDASSSQNLSGSSSQSSTEVSLGGDIEIGVPITNRVQLNGGVWGRRVISGGDTTHWFKLDAISPLMYDAWLKVENDGFIMPYGGVSIAVPTISGMQRGGDQLMTNPAWLFFYLGLRYNFIEGTAAVDQNGTVSQRKFSETVRGLTLAAELRYPIRSGGEDVNFGIGKRAYATIGIAYDTYEDIDFQFEAQFNYRTDWRISPKDTGRIYFGTVVQF